MTISVRSRSNPGVMSMPTSRYDYGPGAGVLHRQDVGPDLRIVEVEGDRITTEDEAGQRTTGTARETVVTVAGMLGAMEG